MSLDLCLIEVYNFINFFFKYTEIKSKKMYIVYNPQDYPFFMFIPIFRYKDKITRTKTSIRYAREKERQKRERERERERENEIERERDI